MVELEVDPERREGEVSNAQVRLVKPDASAATSSTPEQYSEPQQVAEQGETITDMTAMSLSDDLRPASFEGGDSDFISRIEFPDLEGDVDLEVLCEARITRSGRFDWNSCFPKDYDAEEDFIDAVHRASRRAQINPAMRGGRTSSVMIYYRVAFHQDGENQKISIFPNNGIGQTIHGEKYFSPQWVIRRGTRFPCGDASGRQNSVSAFDIRIAASGDATQIYSYTNEDITSDREKSRCERDAARFADREWFIPGALDGGFVEAKFRNLTWNDFYRRTLVVPRDRSNSGAALYDHCINRPLAC